MIVFGAEEERLKVSNVIKSAGYLKNILRFEGLESFIFSGLDYCTWCLG